MTVNQWNYLSSAATGSAKAPNHRIDSGTEYAEYMLHLSTGKLVCDY